MSGQVVAALRQAVAVRDRPDPHPAINPRISISLDEAKELLNRDERLAEAEQRMHLILSTIYDGLSHRDLDVEGQQAAKLRTIERLARLDWDAEGMSRVV